MSNAWNPRRNRCQMPGIIAFIYIGSLKIVSNAWRMSEETKMNIEKDNKKITDWELKCPGCGILFKTHSKKKRFCTMLCGDKYQSRKQHSARKDNIEFKKYNNVTSRRWIQNNRKRWNALMLRNNYKRKGITKTLEECYR